MAIRWLQSVLVAVLALATGGCITWDDSGFDRLFGEILAVHMEDTFRMTAAAVQFWDAQGRWPANVDELREYMLANHPQEAQAVAWDRLQGVTFTPKDDGGLRIDYITPPERRAWPAKAADAGTSTLELNVPKPPGPFLPPIRTD